MRGPGIIADEEDENGRSEQEEEDTGTEYEEEGLCTYNLLIV